MTTAPPRHRKETATMASDPRIDRLAAYEASQGRDLDDEPLTDETTTRVDTGPIAEALGYATDRHSLIEHKLGDLNGALERLAHDLRPVLPNNGSIPEPTPPGPRAEDPEAVDRRSTIARRIVALGHRADDTAGLVDYLRFKVDGLIEHLELKGVDR